MTNFSSFNLPASLITNLTGMNIITPSPVQAGAIPAALEGKDVLATAQTGSGKTVAFLIPLIMKIMGQPDSKALVLVPTRELAIQVKDALVKITQKMQGFKSVVIIGGEAISKQFAQLEKNPNIIIGTPGRICDHLDRESVDLSNVNFLVLDEIDRMLDMGFSQQLDVIFEYFEMERQTLMFSATLPPAIEKLSKKYLKSPVRVALGSSVKAAKEITQEVIHTKADEKFALLEEQLDEREGSIIVFGKTKWGVDKLVAALKDNKHDVAAIHGGLQQRKRESVLKGFRKGDIRILVATDVAARGLDIPHVKHVINYDLPDGGEEYIHRIGRTGRAGMEGHAVSFLTKGDMRKWNDIQYHMNGEKEQSGSRKSSSFSPRTPTKSPRRDKSSDTFGRSDRFSAGSSKAAPKFGAERRLATKNKSSFNEVDNDASSHEKAPKRFARKDNPQSATARAFAKPDFKAKSSNRGPNRNAGRFGDVESEKRSKPFGNKSTGEFKARTRPGTKDSSLSESGPKRRSERPSDFDKPKNPYAKKTDRFSKSDKPGFAGKRTNSAGKLKPARSGRPAASSKSKSR